MTISGRVAGQADGRRNSDKVLFRSKSLNKSFGGVHAVRDISLNIPHGGVFAIIGPNGAGKSTLLNLMSGLYQPDSGTMSLDGVDLVGLKAHRRVRLGLARTFQKIRLFKHLPVLDNVIAGFHIHHDIPAWQYVLQGTAFRRDYARCRDEARKLLSFVGLEERAKARAGSLAYGEQRMLEIARALATSPRLLVVDEPAAGLNAAEVEKLLDRITQLRAGGMTVVIVEHNMDLVMKVADRVLVMDYGQYLFEGAPAEPKSIQAWSPPTLELDMSALLTAERLELAYGEISACRDVSFHVDAGEIVTLIGANGAGKSTTLRAIAGALLPRTGAIRFRGEDITRLPSYERTGLGISLVPEGRRVFPFLTVRENLELGAFKYRKDGAKVHGLMGKIFDMFPRLHERARQKAGTLSGGEQQMLALGRAMMSEPHLICLDEPSLGLAPLVVQDIFRTIKAINAAGTSVLLVEQNARYALETASRGYVLQTGSIVASGNCATLRNDDRVRQAYLGRSAAERVRL